MVLPGAATLKKGTETHVLSKQERERGHVYPPLEGKQLLCGQELNRQKQELKEEEERGTGRVRHGG